MALLNSTSTRVQRHLHRLLCVFVVACTFAAPVGVAEPVARQLDIEAVFLLNLTRFIRWPDKSFPADDAPLYIGLLPTDPIATVLNEAAGGESSGSHPIKLRWIRNAADANDCHLVFFSKSTLTESAQLVAGLRDKPVLLVSDSDGFLRLGGQILLYKRGTQVRLRIDLANLRRSNLTASTSLLRVADLVNK
ncbi:YfiR family protein [Horticoccus luteus]|uniref:YfiR family protein n=1 Tax=Horticoccus luteus TaxID=2862869 RepID=A0A8F9TSF2_9BACT|nr:YfiR family protein [Horticoccus luteus]QYM78374.1 YfiR family protein [Horticoccus luteus]